MGPSCQGRKQLNKEELSLRATMDLVGPSRQALTYSPLPMTLVCLPRRAERSEAVVDGEAPDWNVPEKGKTRQWSRKRRGVGNLTGSGAGWAYT